MKTNIKKILIAIALLMSLGQAANANSYTYNHVTYNYTVTENIEELEYCYLTNRCEVTKYQETIIRINIILIKNGLKGLY